jgi:uncharacterized protein YndB with AHSA1/START domain
VTTQRIEARATRWISAAPARVFDAWVDERAIREWLAAALRAHGLPGDLRRVEVDARVGGSFTLSDVRPDGEAVHWGTYQAIDRPKRLTFTWFTSEEEERDDASTVTLAIAPRAGGSDVTLVHTMHPKWRSSVAQAAETWGLMLTHIAHSLEEPPPIQHGSSRTP